LHGANVYETVALPCNHGLGAAALGDRAASNEDSPQTDWSLLVGLRRSFVTNGVILEHIIEDTQ
jgi:hypothetical protein